MSKIESRIAELGREVPEIAAPVAAYVPATRVGNFVYTSGQLPVVKGKLELTGKVGDEVTTEQAADLAGVCTLNGLAAARGVIGDLDQIVRVVKVTAFVASAAGFTDQALVANGASLLLGDIFGEAGTHVRSAVGVAELPLGAPVEVEFVFEVAA